jgi:hypothetical protein
MSPAAACPEKKLLASRHRADLRVYIDANARLDALAGRDAGQDYARMLRHAQRARMVYEKSRDRLQEHIAHHGCS